MYKSDRDSLTKERNRMNQKIEAPTLEDSDMAQGLSTFSDKATNIVDSN